MKQAKNEPVLRALAAGAGTTHGDAVSQTRTTSTLAEDMMRCLLLQLLSSAVPSLVMPPPLAHIHSL